MYVARMGERRGVYKVLVGKTEGKCPLGRPGLKWIFRSGMCGHGLDLAALG